MMPSILLLDCSSDLIEKLKRQGFNVATGSIGFCSGYRQLPSQVYEKDIFIYNPRYFARNESGGYININQIRDYTPEYSLEYLKDHIFRGAIFLIFINRIADDLEKQNEAYNWIPFMPRIDFTKDHQLIAYRVGEDYNYKYLAPIVLEKELKTPALQKITPPKPAQYTHPPDVIPLIFNRNYEVLGIFIKRGKGELIILPEYKSNNEIISTFLNRVMPNLYSLETHVNFIDQFLSPEEKEIHDKIHNIENAIEGANEDLEEAKEKLTSATRNKIQTIKNDETAVLILNYYDLATQQDDVSLFYLYKIIEALEKKYGSEREAKNILGSNKEWNLIGKTANVSYADIRHAPKPGEKIKEWTEEEIKECFQASEKIIDNYLSTLF
jgi:hypothetical protein